MQLPLSATATQPFVTSDVPKLQSYVVLADSALGIKMIVTSPGVEGQILPDRWVNAASPRECVVEACHPTFDHPSWTLKLQFWPANSAKWKWTCKL